MAASISRWSLIVLYGTVGLSKVTLLFGTKPSTSVPLPLLVVVGTLECALSLGLVLGRSVHLLWASLLLGLAFLASLVVMTLVGVDVSTCGCAGRWELPPWLHLVTALALVLLTIHAILDEVCRP